MSDLLTVDRDDTVAILRVEPLQDGALTADACRAVIGGLRDALEDPDVHGVVICGVGAGLAPDETVADQAIQDLSDMTQRIERSAKPVLAAVQNDIKNEGLALLLACHGAVAGPNLKVSATYAQLEQVPNCGITQRLPRRIGAAASLDLLLTGETWAGDDPRLKGLNQEITESDPVQRACDRARQSTEIEPQTGDVTDARRFQTEIAAARARFPKPSGAQSDILDCVEAALLLPFDQGLAFEAARATARLLDPSSRLIRHTATAEAHARQRSKGLPKTSKANVVVLGRSSEAADHAALALQLGYSVCIEAGRAKMGEALLDLTRKRLRGLGRVAGIPFDTAVSRLSLAETDADLDAADLIFDTGELLPDPPVKLKDGGAWLMTSPDVAVEDRAAEVNAEGRMLRLRKLMRNSQILELSAPPSLQPGMVETVYAALAQDHQHVVFTKDTPGGLVGSLFAALARTALVMLASGQRPSLVEEAARSLGFRQGPLQMIDVLGAGRSLALMRRVYEHRGASLAPLRLLSDRMADVTGGDASRARRALVFHAPAGQSFARDPDLQEWLTEWRSDHDHAPAAWPETDLKDALLAALVREAVNLHANGIVERLSDIDLATVHGLMMDRRRGGPLIAADVAGLLGIKRGLERLTTVDPALWSKSDQLDDMIKYGRRFF